MNMKIDKKSNVFNADTLIWFQIYYNIFVKFAIHNFKMPTVLNYVSDTITIILFFVLLTGKKKIKITRQSICMCVVCALFFTWGYISLVLNGGNLLLYLWALRNYGRFFLWFFCCIHLLDFSKWETHITKLHYILYFNMMLMVFQYFVQNERMDYLNGFFGRYVGGNSAINTFIVALTAENIAALLSKKREFKKVLINILIMLVTCALNEIKIYFLELIMIVIIALLIDSKNTATHLFRFFKILVGFTLLAILGVFVFICLYPDFAENLNIEYFIYYSTRSFNSSTLIYHKGIPVVNRLTVYHIVNKYFLKDVISKICGLGMGAADTSVYISNTFYHSYAPVSYSAFLYGLIFLENGIIGLSIYISFFLYVICESMRKKKSCFGKYERIISGTVASLGIVMGIYNSALKIESSGYMFFVFLSIMFAEKIRKQSVDDN